MEPTDNAALGLQRGPLRRLIREFLPVLDENLKEAHKEYLASKIPAGAYGHVRQRHASALAVLKRDDLPVDVAYLAASMLTIDLRTGLRGKPEAPAEMRRWWSFFREAGFTEKHSIFDIPVKPRPPGEPPVGIVRS